MKHEIEQIFSGDPQFKTVRLSYVYSPSDKFSRYLAGCVERKEEADLFHPFCRAVIHRDDVVAGALTLAQRWDEFPQQILNFGGPQVISRIEFAEALRSVYLDGLRFKITEPAADFFRNRPRVISMKSPLLPKLLGRPASSLTTAASLEAANVQS